MGDENQNQEGSTKKSGVFGLGPFILGLTVAAIFGWYVFPEAMTEEFKQPIAFNHAIHTEDAGLTCDACHYLREDGTFSGVPTTASCAECHSSPITENLEEIRFVAEYVDKGVEIKDKWIVYQKQPDNVFFSHAAHSFEKCTQCHADLYETPQDLCNVCHVDNIGSATEPPIYKENKLSGYSESTVPPGYEKKKALLMGKGKEIAGYSERRIVGFSEGTMMMPTCEACHALPGHNVEVALQVMENGAERVANGEIARATNACFVCHK